MKKQIKTSAPQVEKAKTAIIHHIMSEAGAAAQVGLDKRTVALLQKWSKIRGISPGSLVAELLEAVDESHRIPGGSKKEQEAEYRSLRAR